MITIEQFPATSLPICSISRGVDNYTQTTWNTSFSDFYCDAANKINCKIINDYEIKNFNRFINNLRKIEEIAKFNENWDGYNAPSFQPDVINLTKRIISGLNIQPELFPTADGSIQIEWEKFKLQQMKNCRFSILIQMAMSLKLQSKRI